MHGPNVSNFFEIYNFLKKIKISKKVSNRNQLSMTLKKLFSKNTKNIKLKQKLNAIGQKILRNTYKEISLLLKNEI